MEGAKKKILFLLIILAVCLSGCSLISQKPAQQACTEEAKICPDGSAVGRTGANCEFAQCPVVLEKKNNDNLKTYVNDKYGYSVQYPADYKYEVVEDEHQVSFVSFELISGGPDIPISVIISTSSISNLIKNDVYSLNMYNIKHSQRSINVSGKEAIEFTSAGSESFYGDIIDVYLSKNNLTYILSWTAVADKDVFEVIKNSFKFTK